MTNNRIPRKFSKIIAQVNLNTNATQCGDIVHVYREEQKYLLFNTRTKKNYCVFIDMIRNKDITTILEIQ